MISKTTADTIRRLRNKVASLSLDLKWRREAYSRSYLTIARISNILSRGMAAPEKIEAIAQLLTEFDTKDGAAWGQWNEASRELGRAQRAENKKLKERVK